MLLKNMSFEHSCLQLYIISVILTIDTEIQESIHAPVFIYAISNANENARSNAMDKV